MESTEFTPWYTDTYIAKGNTFEEWRKLTNGLKEYVDWTRVNKDGDYMTGTLAIANNIDENNYLQFPDGSQQYTAAISESLPRAWVNFSPLTQNIRSSYNVSSITKIAAGRYRITYIKPLKNQNYCVIGTGLGGFDNVTQTQSNACIVSPYALRETYVDISISDPTANNWADPNITNVVIYATDEPATAYVGGSKLTIRINQWSGDVWRAYMTVVDNKGPDNAKYRYRLVDGYGWCTKSTISSGTLVPILSRDNTGKNYIDITAVQVFSSTGDLLKTYDVARRFNTNANINGGTSNNFEVSGLTGTAYPDVGYSNQVLSRPDSNNSQVVFDLTLS